MEKAQILIVEDDSIIAMDIENRLKKLGYSVSGIVNYAEKAIEKVEELNPDLVLMDIVLKGEMDGIDAAEIIRSRFDIPVVFLTAYADEERFERAKLTIPFGYILKPFQDRDLKITIEMVLYTAKVDAERKQAEEENNKLQTQLQQAQKMESIGTLAGGIAHDFNNILFPIIGYAEMALEDISEDSSLRNSINEILHGAKRAGDLVKQILTFSRQADQELKPLRVQLVIKEVLKLIRSSLPSTIKINKYINNNCGLVIADPTQIHQVAMNLITNAYHAMEETGGELEVSLKEVDLDVEDLRDPVMMPGAYVCLTVADTGPGMDQLVIDRIFDPYFTTKEDGKGTGLGLAVVHGIVKSYKGDIRVYSEPGEGTVFHVYLPEIETQAVTEEIETITPVQKGTERILLVDDEDQIVRMEKKMLERLGYNVTERTGSIEAFEVFRIAPDRFDLVITDMTMPNMTGVQLSRTLMAIRSDIPIIICSGFSEQISSEKAKAWGISGFVMKPVIMRELAKKIRAVLDQEK